MARRKDRRGIGKPFTVRPDEEMARAMDEDLGALRAVLGKKATRTDVLRSWARIGNRARLVRTLADYQQRMESIAAHAEAATKEANALKRKMQGLEAKQVQQRSKSVGAALRTLALPSAGAVRDLLLHLVREEAAGRTASTSNVTLAKARRELGSWKALQDLLPPPTG